MGPRKVSQSLREVNGAWAELRPDTLSPQLSSTGCRAPPPVQGLWNRFPRKLPLCWEREREKHKKEQPSLRSGLFLWVGALIEEAASGALPRLLAVVPLSPSPLGTSLLEAPPHPSLPLQGRAGRGAQGSAKA